MLMYAQVIPAKGAVDLASAPYTEEGLSDSVISAKAEIQERDRAIRRDPLDSRLRGNDAPGP